MRQILIFFTIIIAFSGHTQNNYYFGYQAGFKYGCQCMDIPLKNVALYNGTYDQGYLDGKVDGLIYSKNKSTNTSNQQYNYNKPHDYNQPLYSPNYELMERALNARQTAYNTNRERIDNYVQSLKETIQLIRDNKSNYAVNNKMAALFLLENAFYKDMNTIYSANLDYSITSNVNYAISTFDKHSAALSQLISDIKNENELTASRLSQMLTLYNSFSNKNIAVKDGWHFVYATNQKDFCEIRRVYVVNNRIKKYVKEGGIYKEWDSLNIEVSTEITNCKSTIKLKSIDLFSEMYFINVLSDSKQLADPPPATGTFSFWTNYNKEQIHIYVENQYVGTLNSSFPNDPPSCGQNGTVVFINKAGTYNYVAVSDKYRWSGTLTITANNCNKQKLTE